MGLPARPWAGVASVLGLAALVLLGCGSLPAPSGAASASPVARPTAGAAASAAVDQDGNATPPSPGEVLPAPAPTTRSAVAGGGRLPGEPDPRLTPGAFNPAVTQASIGSTICVSGWTATVRPPPSYTSALKVQQIGEYGYTTTSTAVYEEDHLIPLELGGAPSDPRNLWPEPYSVNLADGTPVGARVKDAYETLLRQAVCAGTISLAAARARIGDQWVHSYLGIPMASTPTPTPATLSAAPGARATPRPTIAAGRLTVTLTAVPTSVPAGSSATVAARSLPAAVCTITLTLPSGRISTVAALLQSHSADASGAVSWTWTITANTKPGTATVTVHCEANGASATASHPFAIT